MDLTPCARCPYWLGMNPACPACEEASAETDDAKRKRATFFHRREVRLARLRRLGRAPRIGLVGCGKTKREGVHAVRDLYVSRLFGAALAYSEQANDETYVVSALHGILRPDDRI